ncbi:lysylphosphatidylglycerol synthase domain-containing protein [uncultured Pseudoteredinibacter sp.]|uniref:lysylphosphatidylglycerol synthase domain-containing protein n=1 Tax=uncultured Pseudoteredinibacter sp. TaxID=1641701 RepID=UPI00260794A5|nr:lysylphosphatidylglycerol synthase domain-containing protein [uncultured Pseudoteredinibacter sp.]
MREKIRWRGILFIVFLLVAFFFLASKLDSREELPVLSQTQVLYLIGIQVMALFAAMGSWWAAVRGVAKFSLSFHLVFIHVVILQLGKYIPGKVWGVVVRGAALVGKNGLSLSQATAITVWEQMLVLLIGAAIGVCCWLQNVLAVCLVVVAPVFIWLILFKWSWGGGFLGRWQLRLTEIVDGGVWQWLVAVSIVFSWLAVMLAVAVLATILMPGVESVTLLKLSAAMVIAVAVGFLAVFAPGGIGVREGVFVALASQLISMEDAMILVLSHRFVLVFYDLALGAVMGVFLVSSDMKLSGE